MRAGDVVEVDGKRARVLPSSDLTHLDYVLETGERRWIGVAPACGNPRVKVVERGKGEPVATAEWVRQK